MHKSAFKISLAACQLIDKRTTDILIYLKQSDGRWELRVCFLETYSKMINFSYFNDSNICLMSVESFGWEMGISFEIKTEKNFRVEKSEEC